MDTQVRMESIAMQIGSTLFERLGVFDENLLKEFLTQIFTSMHYYRNNTNNKTIPRAITTSILIFFATFMVNYGCDSLIQACDNIQSGILFMILRSEGDKVLHCLHPERERKYVIYAFSNLINMKY